MKDEEARRIDAVEAFRVADNKAYELTTKLTKAERDKKNVEATLNGAERQVEAHASSFARLSTSSPQPEAKLKSYRRNWRRSRRPRNKLCRMDTMWVWQRLRKPLGLRSRSQHPPKEVEQFEVFEKVADLAKEVADDANLPLAAPKDPSKEKEAFHNMEIVLATLPIPTKEDLKGKA
ncbi:hypothetical protein SO802_017655 [Lithocarpus litseifolius]|uniref:Uncharacterized protein n=1 Tax=Lithocarpus litseifolius TaxID=425828 RepID=A0AAW2CIU9_9ROSI